MTALLIIIISILSATFLGFLIEIFFDMGSSEARNYAYALVIGVLVTLMV